MSGGSWVVINLETGKRVGPFFTSRLRAEEFARMCWFRCEVRSAG